METGDRRTETGDRRMETGDGRRETGLFVFRLKFRIKGRKEEGPEK